MNTTVITAALAALSLATVAAQAAPEIETVSVVVPYADLDLAKPAGMATLKSRIETAAKKVCGRAEVRDIADGIDRLRCLKAANASIETQIARTMDARTRLALNARKPFRP